MSAASRSKTGVMWEQSRDPVFEEVDVYGEVVYSLLAVMTIGALI